MQRGSAKNRILDYWIGIPWLNLIASVRRMLPRRVPQNEPARLGVMCSPALGDTLLFSSVLQDLRARYPTAEIIHFCTRENLLAAEIIPGASRRVLVSLTSPLSTVRAMRRERLDAMLDFSSWQRLTALFCLLSGARHTAGFSSAGQYRGRGYDLTVEHRDDVHEVENFRALLRALGMPGQALPACVIPAGVMPLPEAAEVVVFHLWASGQRSWLREWPLERWIELGQRIDRTGTVFALTGSPADLLRTEPVVKQMQQAGINAVAFTGPDGLRSVARLLQRARVVVSVNTGIMHLAAILGAPTVAINGPNRNGRWGPIGPRAIGVEAPGEGCGYLHLGFNFSGQPTDCMERITVELVVEAVQMVEQG